MAQSISNLPVGAKVKFGKIFNNPIQWLIVDKNHSGYPANSVTLMTYQGVKFTCFDAHELTNPDPDFKWGNNRYLYSNIRQWLNSEAIAGQWYSPQYTYDAPPTAANLQNGYNAYNSAPGFLNGFTEYEKSLILPTSFTTLKPNHYGGGSDSFTDKIFLPSKIEIGFSNSTILPKTNNQTEGTKLSYFEWDSSGDNTRKTSVTDDAAMNGAYWPTDSRTAYIPMRTPDIYEKGQIGATSSSLGNVISLGTDTTSLASRPIVNVINNIFVSSFADSDNCYVLASPPLAPSSIIVPEAYANKQLNISWATSTDPDGNLSGYKLERSSNAGAWTQVYDGSALNYLDTINAGWSTVQYRVKAYDTDSLESLYTTSELKTVIPNRPPLAPEIITVPTIASEFAPIQISWSMASDPDGNLSGYILERNVNSETWNQIYSGNLLTFSDNPSSTWNNVKYRVKSYDSDGLESDYTTSINVQISHNYPPNISGTDIDIGFYSENLIKYNYIVTDNDSVVVTVNEYLDNTEINSYTVVLGNTNIYEISNIQWNTLVNGPHEIKITATDTDGLTDTRIIVFSKLGWTTPVIDRTGAIGEFYNTKDYNRANNNIAVVFNVDLPSVGIHLPLIVIDSVQYKSLPIPDIINKTETNLKTIEEYISPLPNGWLPSYPYWTSNPEERHISYSDFNRWENNPYLIHQMIQKILVSFKHCNTYSTICGQSLDELE